MPDESDGGAMVYSNFDTRTKGVRAIPEDRLRFLRKLEEQVRRERAARKLARAAGLVQTTD